MKPRKKQMKPHKHAELIKAWADGAVIQSKHFPLDSWTSTTTPAWFLSSEYRIKPEPKPDCARYTHASRSGIDGFFSRTFSHNNLKLTFDGATGKLKAAEVL